MDRSITGRDGYLQSKIPDYVDALAQRMDDPAPLWELYEVLSNEDHLAFGFACAIAEIQARDDGPLNPWSDCQDMIAIVCNLVPRTLEREKLADEIERLSGLRPDFTDERSGEVVQFPGGRDPAA